MLKSALILLCGAFFMVLVFVGFSAACKGYQFDKSLFNPQTASLLSILWLPTLFLLFLAFLAFLAYLYATYRRG